MAAPRLDWQFGAALLAGPLVWLGLYLVVEPVVDPAWPLRNMHVFLLLVFAFPVVEEAVFRGLIQGYLIRRFPRRRPGPLSLANVLTSVLFAALHLVYRAPAWAAAVFVPSLVFGYFRERHRTLLTPIILHCYYNAGYFLLFAPA